MAGFDPAEFAAFKSAPDAFDPGEFAATKTAAPGAPETKAPPPAPQGLVANALAPITSYPETYANMNREAREQVSHGVDQLAGSDSSWWDRTKGAGNVALGSMGYLTSPIGAGLRTVVGQPVENVTGIPKEYTEFATGLAIPGYGLKGPSAKAPPKLPAPTIDQLHAAADSSFNAVRGFGVEIRAQPVARLADDIFSELHNDGFRQLNVPKVWSAIEELKNPVGKTVTVDDIWSVRKALRKAGANALEGEERNASNRAIAALDQYLAKLDPAHVAVNAHFAPRVSAELRQGFANYAAAKRAELLAEKQLLAGDTAASSGSGANVNNAMRQKLRAVLASPKQLRGFSEDEIDQMRRAVRGTGTGNVARTLGKLAPTGVVSAWPTIAAAAASGFHPMAAAVPAIGFTAKKLGEMSTARQLGILDRMVRERSALGAANAQASAPQIAARPRSPYYLPGVTAGGASGASGLMQQIPGISVHQLRQLQGAVPAGAAEDERP